MLLNVFEELLIVSRSERETKFAGFSFSFAFASSGPEHVNLYCIIMLLVTCMLYALCYVNVIIIILTIIL